MESVKAILHYKIACTVFVSVPQPLLSLPFAYVNLLDTTVLILLIAVYIHSFVHGGTVRWLTTARG